MPSLHTAAHHTPVIPDLVRDPVTPLLTLIFVRAGQVQHTAAFIANGRVTETCLGSRLRGNDDGVRGRPILSASLRRAGNELACGWRRETLAISVVEGDGLVDEINQLAEYGALVSAVTAAEDQTRRRADVALVLLRPFDDLCVAVAMLHGLGSS